MREISRNKYLIAFILTIAIFVIGLLLGLIISKEREDYLQTVISESSVGYESLQLQYSYATSQLGEKKCVTLTKTLEENTKILEESRTKLESYIEQAARESDFNLLKRNYALSQIRYWLLAKQTKQVCSKDMALALFFYSNEEENDYGSRTMGVVLTDLKRSLKDKLLIFSLDYNFDQEPMINILKEAYNVTKTPTLIVEDKKIDGLIDRDELLKVICKSYKTKIEECKNAV